MSIDVTQRVERPWEQKEENSCGKTQMERLGCQMTHTKWKLLRKNKMKEML
jgi:hypothetical protein